MHLLVGVPFFISKSKYQNLFQHSPYNLRERPTFGSGCLFLFIWKCLQANSTQIYVILKTAWDISLVRYIERTTTPFSYASLHHATKIYVIYEFVYAFECGKFTVICINYT